MYSSHAVHQHTGFNQTLHVENMCPLIIITDLTEFGYFSFSLQQSEEGTKQCHSE